MTTSSLKLPEQRLARRYALRRGLGTWEVTNEGRRDSFSDEQGAEYLTCKPHPVLQAFARHLREHLLSPSGRGGGHGGARAVTAFGGCFTYEPPPGVVWERIED